MYITTRELLGSQRMDAIHFLSHPDQPKSKNLKYTPKRSSASSGATDINNLFDDSNVKDAEWMRIAKHHLRRFVVTDS